MYSIHAPLESFLIASYIKKNCGPWSTPLSALALAMAWPLGAARAWSWSQVALKPSQVDEMFDDFFKILTWHILLKLEILKQQKKWPCPAFGRHRPNLPWPNRSRVSWALGPACRAGRTLLAIESPCRSNGSSPATVEEWKICSRVEQVRLNIQLWNWTTFRGSRGDGNLFKAHLGSPKFKTPAPEGLDRSPLAPCSTHQPRAVTHTIFQLYFADISPNAPWIKRQKENCWKKCWSICRCFCSPRCRVEHLAPHDGVRWPAPQPSLRHCFLIEALRHPTLPNLKQTVHDVWYSSKVIQNS